MTQPQPVLAVGAQRILIVDDEDQNRRLLDAMLSPEGYIVESVASGEAAIIAVGESPPDLILLDVMMPGLNGYEVSERLKASMSTRHIPIILITALGDRNARIQGLHAGAEDFVTKPVDRAELSARVRNLLRLKQHGDFQNTYSKMLEEQVAVRTDELLVERDRAQQYLDTAAVTLVALDSAGRVTMLNRHGSTVLGWSESELVGRDWLEVCIPESSRTEARERFARVLSGELSTHETTVMTKSGNERLVEWCDTLLHDESGRVTGTLSSGADVTERARAAAAQREMERQNLQAQKMEVVGRLASGVAHDFNNLLCVVLGWTGLALDDLPKADPIRESLSEVVKAGQAAARLTKQLLAFSRQTVSEVSTFNPNEVVLSTEQMLRRLIGEHIDLVTQAGPELGSVEMDRGQLDQVLMNLVVNARDAMPDGGTLTIATANRRVGADSTTSIGGQQPGEYVVISVSDSGTGMSDEVKARIFEPFFTTKDEDKGTGLGLATCYGIITEAGGHIAVVSEIGKGTTMDLYLPRADAEVSADARPRRVTPLAGVERIFIIEDEAPVRRVIIRMLESLGYQAFGAGDSRDAMSMMEKVGATLDLVLVDVVLAGGTNGRELADRMLELRPDVKLMFMSGYIKDRSLLLGKDDKEVPLLRKPFTADELGAKVRMVLDGI